MRHQLEGAMTDQAQAYLGGLEADVQRIRLLQFDALNDEGLSDLAYASVLMDPYTRVKTILQLQRRLFTIQNSSRLIQEVIATIPALDMSISSVSGLSSAGKSLGLNTLSYPALPGRSTIRKGDRWLYLHVANLYTSRSEQGFNYLLTIKLNPQVIAGDLRALLHQERRMLLTDSTGIFRLFEGLTGQQADALGPVLILNAASPDNAAFTQRIDGENWVAASASNSNLGFHLALYTPERVMLSNIRHYQGWFWGFSLAAASIFLVYLALIYRVLHKPLRRLVGAFERVQTGDMSVRVDTARTDEFRFLYLGFNDMTERLEHLIGQVYQQRILMQNAQLKQLQAQINPHFLYNSFFVLYSMLQSEDYASAETMLLKLGQYFRYITRDGGDEVPMSQEVEHARTYAAIQQVRFSSRIDIQFDDLPEAWQDLQVPRLIIQPLLENTFKYALADKTDNGLLRLRFEDAGDTLTLRLDDNGPGIDENRLLVLQEALDAGGILQETTALINIHRRLQLKFGAGSGLTLYRNEFGAMGVLLRLNKGGKQDVQAADS